MQGVFFLHNWCYIQLWLLLHASGHVISIYACIKFSFAHIRLSCRRGKQPSCMQYKEEGTRRWSKNSAQQEQMCPLKTGWGNSNCRQCTYIELHRALPCMFMNEQLMNYIIRYAEYFQNVPGILYKYVLYTKVVMLLVSRHAFSFAHICLSCRRGKQPSCMQYKEEGTRKWSKNSA